MKELYKQNADKVSLYDVLDTSMEECAELIQACNKMKRANGVGIPTNVTPEHAKAMVIEEIGDVLRCCNMIIYKTGISIDDIRREQEISDKKIADRFEKLTKEGKLNNVGEDS